MKILLRLERHERRLWAMSFPEIPDVDCGRPRDSLRKARREALTRLRRCAVWSTPIQETEVVEQIVLPQAAHDALERRRAAIDALEHARRQLASVTREALREVIVNADVSYRDAAEMFGLSRSRLSKLIGRMRLKGKAEWLRTARRAQLDFLARGGIGGSPGLKPRVKHPSELIRWNERKRR